MIKKMGKLTQYKVWIFLEVILTLLRQKMVIICCWLMIMAGESGSITCYKTYIRLYCILVVNRGLS